MDKKIFYVEYKGSFLPEEIREGRVQSTYSKAINLLYSSGILLSIVNSIDLISDYGLTVADFDLLISGISKGIQFKWEGNKIIFTDIIIDLSGASKWTGVLSGEFPKIFPDIVSIKSAFHKFAAEEGLSPVYTNKAGNIYSHMAEKLIKKAVEISNISAGILIDLSFLVGMGIGFTPSGDDFLAGVMLFETITGTNLVNRQNIEDKLNGTTVGGRTLLSLALNNSYPFYLKQFAKTIYTYNFSSDELVKQVINHGSTSGSDALAGFLWAVEKNEKLQP